MKHTLSYKNTIQHFSVPGSSYQPTQRLKRRGKKEKKNSHKTKEKEIQVQIKIDSTYKKVTKRKRKIFSLHKKKGFQKVDCSGGRVKITGEREGKRGIRESMRS